MKNKYIIAILIVGIMLTIFGALLKIMHYQFGAITGNLVLTIGMILKVIALFLFIIKIVTNKKNDFLNK